MDWFWFGFDLLRDFFCSPEGSKGKSCEGRRCPLWIAMEERQISWGMQKAGAYQLLCGHIKSLGLSPFILVHPIKKNQGPSLMFSGQMVVIALCPI